MRHRMGVGAMTGFGNPDKAILDNKWTEDHRLNGKARKIMELLTPLYFQEWNGCDFSIERNSEGQIEIACGIEPGYQYDPLKIICIHSNKGQSSITTGRAWGAYGSQIASKTRKYSDYKKKCKFLRVVDQCHKILMLEAIGQEGADDAGSNG